jgi:hypothetical protein
MYQDYITYQHQMVEAAQQMMLQDLKNVSARVVLL